MKNTTRINTHTRARTHCVLYYIMHRYIYIEAYIQSDRYFVFYVITWRENRIIYYINNISNIISVLYYYYLCNAILWSLCIYPVYIIILYWIRISRGVMCVYLSYALGALAGRIIHTYILCFTCLRGILYRVIGYRF